MHNGCGHTLCHFNSKCAHGATHLISKAKHCSRGPVRAFKTQNKIQRVKKPWPLVRWLKGAFREHLKQFCQTQGIEIAWRSGGCNWLAGVAGAGKEQGAAGLCCRLGHSGWARVTNRVPQLCCCAGLPKFPFLLLYWALWEGPAGGKELSPLPAPDYFGRAKLRLKWCPSKQGNFCLLYAYHSLSLHTHDYIYLYASLPTHSLLYAADECLIIRFLCSLPGRLKLPC